MIEISHALIIHPCPLASDPWVGFTADHFRISALATWATPPLLQIHHWPRRSFQEPVWKSGSTGREPHGLWDAAKEKGPPHLTPHSRIRQPLLISAYLVNMSNMSFHPWIVVVVSS